MPPAGIEQSQDSPGIDEGPIASGAVEWARLLDDLSFAQLAELQRLISEKICEQIAGEVAPDR
jgi:hypothetical protein